ncbi:MAG: DUF3267 domain-containing protein [Halobacteriales archaeon]|nr:DUF3267 domain-containing protein [Halobacteriales archaeon]
MGRSTLPTPPGAMEWANHDRDRFRSSVVYSILLILWSAVVGSAVPDLLARVSTSPGLAILGFFLGFLSVIPHELIHALLFRLQGYDVELLWTKLRGLDKPKAIVPAQRIDRRTILLVQLAPFLLLTPIGILFISMSNPLVVQIGVWMLFFNIVGSNDDWYDFLSFSRLSNETEFAYESQNGEWDLFKTVRQSLTNTEPS